jgi:hypothetical protein
MTGLIDPFEDAVNAERWWGGTDCPPDGGFLWRISALRIVQNGGLRPEGYGVAWQRQNTDEFICAPMPWNVLIGALYHVRWWLVWPWKGPAALEAAWNKGMEYERAHGNRRLREQQREFETVLEHAKAQARQEVWDHLAEQWHAMFPTKGRES